MPDRTDRKVTDMALWLATGAEVVEGVAVPDNPDWEGMTGSEIVAHEFGYTCSTRIGTEDGVLPIYCGRGDAAPLAGNSAGHALCGFHVRTATRSTKNGTTIFTGVPVPDEFGPTAIGRREDEACQCGTPGCRVDHAGSADYACDTW